ncbi:nucleotide sugar dehydrogenase, partial [Staphylococcus hominis]
RKIGVVCLVYLGLPVAVNFGKKHKVICFDINENRIKELKENYDRTTEVTSEDLKETNSHFTSNSEDLKKSDFIIVAVPT